nr:MAG TPA: major tail protein [Caudoviricetes sp.]
MGSTINTANFPVKENTSMSLAGKNVLLFLNYGEGVTEENPNWLLVGGQRNSPLTMSADEIDASDKGSGGWGETLPGTKTWSIEQENVYKVNNVAAAALKYAFINDVPVNIMRWDKYGNAMKGWCNITEFSDDNPHDDVATINITMSGVGEPQFVENEPDPRTVAGRIVDLTATSPSAGKAKLTFPAPTGANGIVLQQSDNSIDFIDTETIIAATATTVTIENLKAGTKYFRLRVNGGLKNGYSNVASVIVS